MGHVGHQLDIEEVDLRNPRVRWFTYLNDGRYVQLSTTEHNQFEQAILDGKNICTYVIEHKHADAASTFWTYEIDLTDLSYVWQGNLDTGKWRRLYRIAYWHSERGLRSSVVYVRTYVIHNIYVMHKIQIWSTMYYSTYVRT